MKTNTTRALIAVLFLAIQSLARPAESVVEMEKFDARANRDDVLEVLPGAAIQTTFGMSQSVFDTPRSLSIISSELMDRYDVKDINDLVAIAPGTFTSSFYGIAGQIDVRGTPGETYFRGMKRIENPGNYPTPIAASDRIDIVRGPPSPIFGPGKVGGYLDFQPKSARARTGRYLEKPTGGVKATFGSFEKRVVTAEVGGPGKILGKRAGYYAYVLKEDSKSYYQNGFQDQFIVQTTFDIDVTPTVRLEFGEQYHYWKGSENAGWNRVTQELINNGTYLAGSAQVIADTNGDGFISPAEMTAVGGLTTTWVYGTPPPTLGAQYRLDPATVKLVQLDGSQVLIDSIDSGVSDSFNFFFDVIADKSPNLTVTNKFFMDYLDRNKHASYGFSQAQKAFSAENKIIVEQKIHKSEKFRMENAYTLAYRYYDVEARSDSIFELAERRDLSVGATGNDRSLLSYYDSGQNPWGTIVQSTYTDLGIGMLSNMHFFNKVDLMGGVRGDFFRFSSENALGIRSSPGIKGIARKKPLGYSGSLSFNLTPTIKPYITYAHQPTPLIGQTGEASVASVLAKPLYDSEMREVGVKTELFNKKLFASASAYRQNRSSFDIRTNTITATRSEGIETELRWAPSKTFNMTGAATFQKTVFLPVSSRTVFTTPLLTGNDPASAYAGTLRATLPASDYYAESPGQPDRVMSLFGTYFFRPGWAFTLGGTYTARVAPGSSQLIYLPSSLVLNTNVTFDVGAWGFKFSVNNFTDERYFRPLSPGSFGDFTTLPMLPINYQGGIGYRF